MWLIIGATFAALGCGNVIAPTGAVELSMSAFRPVADSAPDRVARPFREAVPTSALLDDCKHLAPTGHQQG